MRRRLIAGRRAVFTCRDAFMARLCNIQIIWDLGSLKDSHVPHQLRECLPRAFLELSRPDLALVVRLLQPAVEGRSSPHLKANLVVLGCRASAKRLPCANAAMPELESRPCPRSMLQLIVGIPLYIYKYIHLHTDRGIHIRTSSIYSTVYADRQIDR